MILVTGGAGFIGSRLLARLQQVFHDEWLISIDDYSSGSEANHIAGVSYVRGHTKNIRDLMPDETPRLIYHLGEYSRVERSFIDSRQVYKSNIVGTGAVLDYWEIVECKLVYAGSSTMFSSGDVQSTPYTRSKKLNAWRVRDIGRRQRMPWAVTYFYNAYGPGERAGLHGTLIEIFRQHRLEGAPLPVVSPGTQRRNFTHVDDIVEGLLLAGSFGQGELPIGAAQSYSVLEVADMFGGPVEMLPARTGNRPDAVIDTSAIEAIGWRQRRFLKDYVAQAVAGSEAA